MELVEKGLHPNGPRIIHQSWTTHDLPLHFEKKTLAWRKYHSYDWV
jgi:mannosyltransferase OCH1-like enzyme